MRILRNTLISLILLALLIGIIGFFLPSQAHVERAVVIDAPVAEVYAVLSDLTQFNRWSPWYDIDPNATYDFTGTAGTVGSTLSWSSELREVGSGSQSVVALTPDKEVCMSLDFGSGGPSDAYYRLTPTASGTQVVWAFDADLGANPYAHYFAVAMDSMLGPAYEKGLAQLKHYIEEGAPD